MVSLGIIFMTVFLVYEIYNIINNPPVLIFDFISALLGTAIYSLFLIIFAGYTVYSVSKCKSNAVGLAKMLLIIYIINNFLGLFIPAQFPTIIPLITCSLWLIYFFKSKRVKNTFPINKRQTYLVDRVIFGILLAVTLFGLIGLFLDSNQIYVGGENNISQTTIASKGVCYPPNQQVGLRCCIPVEDMDGLCADEEEEFIRKLEPALINNMLSGRVRVEYKDPIFSLITPEGYYLVKNVEMGGLKYPFYLIAFGEDDEEGIEIAVVTRYLDVTAENLEKSYALWLAESLELMDRYDMNYEIINKGMFDNEELVSGAVLDMIITYPDNTKEHSKSVSFINFNTDEKYIVSLKFRSSEDYEDYISEFDQMIDSFRFSGK